MNPTKVLAVSTSLTHPASVCRPRSDRRVHQEHLGLCAVREGMLWLWLSLLYEGRGAVPLYTPSPGPLCLVFPEKVCVIYREGAEEETARREGAPDNTLV